MEEKKKIRKTRCCRSCCTPMKGHRKHQCRPNPWYDGKTQQKHGGHYEWETQRWTGSKWEPLEDVVNKNDETSNESDSKSEAAAETPAETPAVEEEWKPLADRYWWNYYTNWQQNSTFVKFPTLVGMTSAQLGDIMENYGKYRNYYYYN